MFVVVSIDNTSGMIDDNILEEVEGKIEIIAREKQINANSEIHNLFE